MHTYTRSFIRNIELWLSFAGLAVILCVPVLLAPGNLQAFWKVAAFTAIGVGLLHGVLFWTVRRRQRRMRRQAIAEIREMLGDRVQNQLAVINMYLPQGHEEGAQVAQRELEGVHESIDLISAQVHSISEESLRDWKSHYAEALENATNLEAA